MKRPLLKLYISIAIALLLAVVFVPGIIGKTSSIAAFAAIKANLMSYNAKLEPEPLPEGAHAVIIMDDGWQTQYTKGYEIMSRYDMKGCIAVVPALVGTEGYMDFGQLATMYMDGWDMLNHTYSHDCLTNLDSDSQAEMMNEARSWLTEHRLIWGADIVVFPNGAFSDDTIGVLKENGFKGGRSLNSVWDAESGCRREDLEIYSLISDSTMEHVKAAIDKAIVTGNTCILVLNKIEPVTIGDQMQIDEELFEEVVKYLYDNREDISVVTLTQLLY